MRLLPVCLVAVSVGCGGEGAAPVGPTEGSAELRLESDNPNPMLFPKDARPYGRSIERWSELLWSYIYAQPADHNPFFDTTGADCAVGQEGPVWFLPAVPGSSLGTEITRSCTIRQHRAVMLQLSSALNDYPCPDPTFQPAPGQSLYDFLIGGISPLFDGETGFEVFLDGVAIKDPLSYRFTSDDLFFFKGDPSMQAFDSCVTGRRQPAVSDGFYLMFKPLSPGEHTIVINGHDMHGVPVTLTENLTIR
jgi:hypothetical protein